MLSYSFSTKIISVIQVAQWHCIENVHMCVLIDKDGGKVTTVMATPGTGSEKSLEIHYTDSKVIGNGSFGVVFQARLVEGNDQVAIKKVLQDKRFKVSPLPYSDYVSFLFFLPPASPCSLSPSGAYFVCAVQNRELQIMQKLDHQNIVKLKYFFYSTGDKVCAHKLPDCGCVVTRVMRRLT